MCIFCRSICRASRVRGVLGCGVVWRLSIWLIGESIFLEVWCWVCMYCASPWSVGCGVCWVYVSKLCCKNCWVCLMVVSSVWV